jgi:hypothetical protein
MPQINITTSLSEKIARIAPGPREYSPYKSAIDVETIDTDERSCALLESTPQETYIYAVYLNDVNGNWIELFSTIDEATATFDKAFGDWSWDGVTMLKPQLQPQIDEAIANFQRDPAEIQGVSEPEGYSTLYLHRFLVSNQAPHVDEENPQVVVARQGLGVQYHSGADAIYYVTDDDDGRNYTHTIVANYDIASKTFSNLNEPVIVERFQSIERFKRAAAFYEFHV